MMDEDPPYYYENQQRRLQRERSTSRDRSDKISSPRDRSRSLDRDEKKKERRGRREKNSKRGPSERGLSRSGVGETSRAGDAEGSASFSAQVGGSGFSQFPGQTGAPAAGLATEDSHVAHQFPGQDPTSFAAPYRPPNGVGLAADYYGDQGQSVMSQPGVRPLSPKVNAQPHLMAPTANAAPPQETGHGAADDYFGGTTVAQMSSATAAKPSQPNSRPSKSKISGSGITPLTSALAGGAALGHVLGHHSAQSVNSSMYAQNGQESTSSVYQQGDRPSVVLGAYQIASSQGQSLSASNAGGSISIFPGNSPRYSPTHSPSHSQARPGQSHAEVYAAGAAGLAAGAYALQSDNAHKHSASVSTSGANLYGTASHGQSPSKYGPPIENGHRPALTAMQHKHRGPITKAVEWWKDYEDVRKMEEYTEYIGVCRDCFDSRTNLYDAPRIHHYRKRKSNGTLRERKSAEFRKSSEHLASGRVNKESRYYRGDSSENEGKRMGKGSWIATGLAGYGLAKAGKALVGSNVDFDDTYSVKSGRRMGSRTALDRSRSRSGDRESRTSRGVIRRRSSSLERKSRVTGQVAGSFVDGLEGTKGSYRIERRRSKRTKSRSRSRDRTSAIIGASTGAAVVATGLAASRKHRSRSNSPRKQSVRVRHGSHRGSQENISIYGPGDYRNRGSQHSLVASSREDVSATKGGVFGGFFSSEKDRRRKSHSKRGRGFFTFGNASSSSSDVALAYGMDIRRDKRKRTPEKRHKRKSSDEKLNATLLGIGATAAALAVAQHGKGNHRSDVIAVKERRGEQHTRGVLLSRPSGGSSSSVGSDDEGWESAGDDSSSVESSGLAYGDFDFKGKARKSTDSLVSNDSGTWKWGWRWGRKKRKQPSSDLSYAGTSFIAPAVSGAIAGSAVVGAADAMSTVSSQQSLQSVYPVPTSDSGRFEAIRRFDSTPSSQPQPLWTSRPENVPLHQPQAVAPVSDSVYTTQPQYSPAYVAPMGPPVVYSASAPKHSRHQSYSSQDRDNINSERPQTSPRRKRRSSSPIQSSLGRDAAIAGFTAAATGGAIPGAKPFSSKDVRFDLESQQSDRETALERREREEKASRRRDLERQRLGDEEDRASERRKRDAEIQLQQERDTERLRTEREDVLSETAAHKAAAQQAAIQEEAERADQARLKRETKDRERDRKERDRREARENRKADRRRPRDHDILAKVTSDRDQEPWTKPVVAGIAGAAAGAAIASFASLSKHDNEGRQIDAEIQHKTYSVLEPKLCKGEIDPHVAEPSTVEPPKKVEVQPQVIHVEPSKVEVDKFEDDTVFDPDYFKKKRAAREALRQSELAQSVAADNAADEVIADFEDRYNEGPVNAGDFFAPVELLDHSTSERKIDANSDSDIHLYHGIESNSRGPPYQKPYMFTATKDGAGSSSLAPWHVPVLNLIEPTPPGSRCSSPSPDIRDRDHPVESVDKLDEINSAPKGVTWGEDETFHFDAPTPESFHDSYISERDIDRPAERETSQVQNHDEVMVEAKESGADLKRTTYRPEILRSPLPPAVPTRLPGEPVEWLAEEMETPVFESHPPGVEPVVVTPGEDQRREGAIYQYPYFETVSDLGSALGYDRS